MGAAGSPARPGMSLSRQAVEQTDALVLRNLLGRQPAAAWKVVLRGREGEPVVIENAPICEDGRPMPTRFWLVDRALCRAVGRLEAAGGVRSAERALAPALVAAAHQRYAAGRDAAIPDEQRHRGPLPSGGVGGTRAGVKCLHAHLAWYLAGGDDPVGWWTAQRLGGEVTSVIGPLLQSHLSDGEAGPSGARGAGPARSRRARERG